ncbi:Nucleoside-diphosphate kinase [Acidimicrobium ferrooxidans DSM 10331]|uniref:Nucleoside diphosphate kinase n=1 Tax=Acidimicrobium ferrooxidans (strain DSM 10331 / JCM 15462 / NBRC 103882 / ICP) TaxID=525909 RepID=C7LYA5_ACIFD|nr:nucleoside-diphosphate kinase [Acidimicrobium ferrooxidans]ACU53713.1 Nucleoside-diphosphate kinase [Acidimicrobium ferrooxidans DSM 10331]
MQRTLVILKPDAVERGLVGEILARLEAKGLRFERLELRQLDKDTVRRHYAEHEGKPFYDGLVGFLTRGPVVVAAVTGPGDAVGAVRALMGATDPAVAAPGTIRGDLAMLIDENLIHGSDSPGAAARELALFFPDHQ